MSMEKEEPFAKSVVEAVFVSMEKKEELAESVLQDTSVNMG